MRYSSTVKQNNRYVAVKICTRATAQSARIHRELEFYKHVSSLDSQLLSLEESEKTLDGENKTLFLKFMRSMLRWLPEERKAATELLKDPWLAGAIP